MTRTRLGVAIGLCIGVGAAYAAVSSYRSQAGIVSAPTQASAQVAATAGAAVGSTSAAAAAGRAGAGSDQRDGTFIVVLKEPALASYKGGTGRLAAPERTIGRSGKARLDVHSASAREYVRHLRDRQTTVEATMARTARAPIHVRSRMQHALNGMIVDMRNADADAIRKLADVALVEEYREYAQDTDHGPQIIGAPAVWNGSNPGAPAAYQGEGMVAGILDSGINFGSPSFAAVSPKDGYQHVNPLGRGNYLGTCAPGGVDEGRCNDKLIGGYDFVCGPPANTCSNSTFREEPGFGDTNSHGSHVASTIAGNRRDATFSDNPISISGVAPRANVVAYDVCYTDLSNGGGWCPNVSSVAGINQAIADGVVDVLNFSVGGGSQPWSDAVSLAFLNAVDAGIYVAASAGNSGPGPNTMGHLEPWVSSTAAAQHGRGSYGFTLQISGPQPVPEPLSPALINPGVDGVAHTTPIPATTPVKISSTFDGGADACAAYPADTFKDAIAVVQRGGCSFTIKTNNVTAAGARAVVIVNNSAAAVTPSVPDTTIRVFGMDQETGLVLRDFLNAHADATGGIGYPAIPIPNVPDALASFSSRGPAGTFDLVKPNVTAPGVDILAVVAGDTISGHENALGLMSGTSMASPHQAGAAVLVRQARPGWTVPEVMSALAMTADETVLLEDQVTPANAFAGGAGRIRVDKAINAGLVLDESKDNFLAADPGKGGDVSALNLAGLGKRSCFESCEFVRTFRNPTATEQRYRMRLSGVSGRVVPSTISVPAGGSAQMRVIVNSRNMPADGSWNFGKVELIPVNPKSGQLPLHLPITVAVQPPQATATALDVTLRSGKVGAGSTVVGNLGGSSLKYSLERTGTGTQSLVSRFAGGVTTGFRGTIYTDQTATRAEFASDDFTLSQQAVVSRLAIDFFMPGSGQLAAVTPEITWSIYPDANGVPAGNPLTAAGTAVWSYTSAPTAAGVAINGTQLSLDLTAAGQQVNLPAGRYWLVVNTRSTLNNRMAWYASGEGNGSFATMAVPASGAGSWTSNTTFAGLTTRVTGLVSCSTAWVGQPTPNAGTLVPRATRSHRVPVSAVGLSAGAYSGNLCVVSNDPTTPRMALPVRLTVTP